MQHATCELFETETRRIRNINYVSLVSTPFAMHAQSVKIVEDINFIFFNIMPWPCSIQHDY